MKLQTPNSLPVRQAGKLQTLKSVLMALKRVIIAYSGGLDSTFLLKVAIDTLGKKNVLAVTTRSETYPLSEYNAARKMAKELKARHITIHTQELRVKNFKLNPVNRCYYCKKELFKKLVDIKRKMGFGGVIDGTNYDDLKDIRYGRKAAKELGIRSPLLEAKITKADIRRFSKLLKLPTWDKPSFACLASRIPFGRRIERNILKRIDEAEGYIRRLGIRQVRVRAHGRIARIEISRSDFGKALKRAEDIAKELKHLGFVYVALDLVGYRTGSMHEGI